MTRALSRAIGALAVSSLAGCSECGSPRVDTNMRTNGYHAPANAQPQATLQITDVSVGSGAEAVNGKNLTVRYKGTLDDGSVFDTNLTDGAAFTFVLGSGKVIAGWDQGLSGMRVGGVRRLVIPSHLAYGHRAMGDKIPPDATLTFEVQLLKVD